MPVSALARRALKAAHAARVAAPRAFRGELGNSNTAAHIASASPGSEDYKTKVSEPMMRAVDEMPAAFRALVHAYGYVDVYRAWKRGMSAQAISKSAQANGGRFQL